MSLCAAVPNARWVEYIPQLADLTTAPMQIKAGKAVPSDAPGLGIDWGLCGDRASRRRGLAEQLRLSRRLSRAGD